MGVKVLFTTSKDIYPKYGVLKIGKYRIEPIPCNLSDSSKSKVRWLLKFQDEIQKGKRRSNPIGEAKLFLSSFALLTQSKLEIDSSMIENIKTGRFSSAIPDTYKEYRRDIKTLPDFELYLNNLNSLDPKIARQFLRACEVYRTAINLIGLNNTLSFFLLCVSIECVSNKVSNMGGNRDKFINFILTYLPTKADFETDADWENVLKEIYYNYRSGFTHGGKPIPEASSLADSCNLNYVKNIIDGKEVKSPGLKWFEHAVHDSLIGFLSKAKQKEKDNQSDLLKEISLESGIVELEIKKDIKPEKFSEEIME